MKPLRPWYVEFIPYIALGLCIVVAACMLVVLAGAHDVERDKCSARGGKLVCAYMSPCQCLDRRMFK